MTNTMNKPSTLSGPSPTPHRFVGETATCTQCGLSRQAPVHTQDPRLAVAEKSQTIREVEEAINYALIVWGHDDDEVRRILLQCRGDLREHLEGART
jgi:hypothetical protein